MIKILAYWCLMNSITIIMVKPYRRYIIDYLNKLDKIDPEKLNEKSRERPERQNT